MTKLLALITSGQTQILALLNAVMGLLLVFHVVFTEVQLGAIDLVANCVLAVLAVLLSNSGKGATPDPAVKK